MTPKEIMQAINEVKDHVNEMELKLSKFIDMVHGNSTEGINESQSTIVNLEIKVAELEQRVKELEGNNDTAQ